MFQKNVLPLAGGWVVYYCLCVVLYHQSVGDKEYVRHNIALKIYNY